MSFGMTTVVPGTIEEGTESSSSSSFELLRAVREELDPLVAPDVLPPAPLRFRRRVPPPPASPSSLSSSSSTSRFASEFSFRW